MFNYINENQPVSRASIAHATGLSPTTVSSLVDELIVESMVLETGVGKLSGSGRKPIMIEVNPSGGCVVGVEIKAGRVDFEVFNLEGRSLLYHERIISDYSNLGDIISCEVERLCNGFGRLLGICIGVPGVIDRKTKRVLSTLIPIKPDNDFFSVLCKRFPDVKIKLGNESSYCAYIEKAESKKGIRDLVYIDINVGIGAGIILDNRIFTGAFGNAGEFGHVSVDINGRACKCGNRGCLEAMAGTPAICEAAGVTKISEIDTSDEKTLEKLHDIGRYIAAGINNIVNMINPEMVILGGEIVKLGEPFLEMIRRELETIMFDVQSEKISVVYSSVDGNPVTKGAGRYLLDRIFEDGDFIIE
ncbi:MAG: ROK family protein [Oscillospiraceae bacterium]|nr:ROK family protein [Oscillospiraceae bacterium]